MTTDLMVEADAREVLQRELDEILRGFPWTPTTESVLGSIIRQFEETTGWKVAEWEFLPMTSTLNLRLMPPADWIRIEFVVDGVYPEELDD